jgi:hypothetical protein
VEATVPAEALCAVALHAERLASAGEPPHAAEILLVLEKEFERFEALRNVR